MKKKFIALSLYLFFSSSLPLNAKSVMTIGGGQKDIFIRYKGTTNVNSPLKKKKIEIQNPLTYTAAGGGAVNAAISFQRQGFATSIFLKLGQDESSQFFFKKLESEGINTNHIILSPTYGTGISYIVPCENGDHTILVYRGSNEFLKPEDLPEEVIKGSDILYATSLNGESKNIFLPALQIAKEGNVVTAVNPGSAQIRQEAETLKKALPYIDILLLNKVETKHLIYELVKLNPELKPILDKENVKMAEVDIPDLLKEQIVHEDISFNLTQFFKIILDFGPKVAVVTNGSKGVYVATNKNIYFVPSAPADVINTTGAGDAFNSCFVGMLLKHAKSLDEAISNGKIERAITLAVVNSASVITFMDSNKGLLNQDELEMRARFVRDKLELQKFPLE